jgi:hypothetical protein
MAPQMKSNGRQGLSRKKEIWIRNIRMVKRNKRHRIHGFQNQSQVIEAILIENFLIKKVWGTTAQVGTEIPFDALLGRQVFLQARFYIGFI